MQGTLMLRFTTLASGVPYLVTAMSRANAGPKSQFHGHDFHELTLITKGSARHDWQTGYQQAIAGDLVCVRSRDFHRWTDASDDFAALTLALPTSTWRRFCESSGTAGLAREWEDATEPPHWCAPDPAQIESAMLEAMGALLEGDGVLSLNMLLLIVVKQAQEHAEREGVPEWLIRALGALSADDESLAAGLDRLLEAAGVSLPHLCRVVKRCYGISPTQLINRLRANRAATLLLTTDLSSDALAQLLGLTSRTYLHRVFRETMGKGPEAYRSHFKSVLNP